MPFLSPPSSSVRRLLYAAQIEEHIEVLSPVHIHLSVSADIDIPRATEINATFL